MQGPLPPKKKKNKQGNVWFSTGDFLLLVSHKGSTVRLGWPPGALGSLVREAEGPAGGLQAAAVLEAPCSAVPPTFIYIL